MLERTVFCPARDRDVPVLLREGALDSDAAHLHATGAFLCLDYGVRCTGAMCPLAAVPVDEEERALHREAVARLLRRRARARRDRRGGRRRREPLVPLRPPTDGPS